MPKNSSLSKINIGTTFSYREAELFCLDWRETLKAIINLGLKPIRIGAYWDKIENTSDNFDFSIQDEIISTLS